jgi:TatD DNase family protein
MQSQWITKAVQIWCDIESSEKAIGLAESHKDTFYATVWLHPETAQNEKDFELAFEMEKLILEKKDSIVALGETGLDFHYLDGTNEWKNPIDWQVLSPKALSQIENQKHWWRIHFELAEKYDLPLVIHTRDARDATLDFMKNEGIGRAVMHCFSEDLEFANELMDFSSEIYFSFSWIVTYKSAIKIQEAAKNIPIEKILVETDAPFLAPQPVRGQVCEPAFTRYTLEKIAELRGVSVALIEGQIYENSLRFYGIKS